MLNVVSKAKYDVLQGNFERFFQAKRTTFKPEIFNMAVITKIDDVMTLSHLYRSYTRGESDFLIL